MKDTSRGRCINKRLDNEKIIPTPHDATVVYNRVLLQQAQTSERGWDSGSPSDFDGLFTQHN